MDRIDLPFERLNMFDGFLFPVEQVILPRKGSGVGDLERLDLVFK